MKRLGLMIAGSSLCIFWNSASSQIAHCAPASPEQPSGPPSRGPIMKYGIPGTENIRYYEGFVLSYSNAHRTSNWVCEHLTRQDINSKNGNVTRDDCKFFEDSTMHAFFRASIQDYKGSGFDRGHLAAAGNHKYSQKAMCETFSLSNMSPQVGKGFNRGTWNRLERHVYDLAKLYTHMYICSGPLYLPYTDGDGKRYVRYQVIGENHVSVPTHFFKVILGETDTGRIEIQAFIMPNTVIADDAPLSNFLVALETVEKASGHLFFDKLQNKYECVKRDSQKRLIMK